MKIALVGDALSTRHLAPFGDPNWEIWAAGNGYTHIKRATRYFELHKWSDVAPTIKLEKRVTTDAGLETNFWEAPLKLGCTHIYTGAEVPDRFAKRPDGTPVVAEFPFAEMLGSFPFPYFTASFAWLIAFAITLEPEEIALYGFDLSLEEYVSQKGSVEHFLGIAVGRGIKVTAAPRSMILRTPFLYALETTANRRARSILMDQRYVIEKEMVTRQKRMDDAFYAQIGAVSRVDEHKAICPLCKPGQPCERFGIIRRDFATSVTHRVEADLDLAQLKARWDENNYTIQQTLIDDDYGPDLAKEDRGLPVMASTKLPPIDGPTHVYPLDKELAVNVSPNGDIAYEIQGDPSMTEVLSVYGAKDGR